MSRALVLNATYEPLCVVADRRALVLVLAQKAAAVEHTDRVARSERRVEPAAVGRPARPLRAGAAPGRRAADPTGGLRAGRWALCLLRLARHQPRPRRPAQPGGLHVWENVVSACRRCNHVKADRERRPTSGGACATRRSSRSDRRGGSSGPDAPTPPGCRTCSTMRGGGARRGSAAPRPARQRPSSGARALGLPDQCRSRRSATVTPCPPSRSWAWFVLLPLDVLRRDQPAGLHTVVGARPEVPPGPVLVGRADLDRRD